MTAQVRMLTVADREGIERLLPDAGFIWENSGFGAGVFDNEELLAVAIGVPDGDAANLVHISSAARDREGLDSRAIRAVTSLARRRDFTRVQLEGGDEVIDIPAIRVVERAAARLLAVDGANRILLMHWRDPFDGFRLWEPPGGGIEEGEDPAAAVRREWIEETGLPLPPVIGGPTMVARDQIWVDTRVQTSEYFYLGRVEVGLDLAIDSTAFTEAEKAQYLGYAWVRIDDLGQLEDPIEPELLAPLARLGLELG